MIMQSMRKEKRFQGEANQDLLPNSWQIAVCLPGFGVCLTVTHVIKRMLRHKLSIVKPTPDTDSRHPLLVKFDF